MSGCAKKYLVVVMTIPAIAASCRPRVRTAEPGLESRLIYVHYQDLRQETFPGDGEDIDPAVSLDGSLLAFASTRHGAEPEIYVARVGGRVVERVTTHPEADRHPAFSPDGAWVAFTSRRNGNWDIYMAELGGDRRLVQVTRSPEDEVCPAWSPDGRWLAFSRLGRGESWSLWLREVRSGTTSAIGSGLFPRFSPDGRRIAFVHRDGRGRLALWTISPDGSGATEVIGQPGWSIRHPEWTSEGAILFTASPWRPPASSSSSRRVDPFDHEGRRQLWMVRPDGAALTNLTAGGHDDGRPAFGGNRVFFVSDRGELPAIWSLVPHRVNYP